MLLKDFLKISLFVPLNLPAAAADTKSMRHRMDNLPGATPPMIFCRSCASPLVQALDWEQEDESSWSVRLWCPDCGFEQAAVLDRPQLIYLSLAVEGGFGWMLDALAELDSLRSLSEEPDLVEKALTDRITLPGR